MTSVEISGTTVTGVPVETPGSASGQEPVPVTAFFGIPYAKAPIGARRFLPPEPADLGPEFNATSYGHTSAQNQYPEAALAIVDNPLHEGEDSLNLNVWTADINGHAPVYVFIHGGAYRNGSGTSTILNGASFAANGIVAVTINYRLGVDGGIQLEDGTSNNMLRDQIAALEWVRDNIAAFGGNPDHVVVGGESAGAMSIGALLSSPKAKGLFHGAILESGAAHNVVKRSGALEVGRYLAQHLGVEPNAEALGTVAPEKILAASAAVEAEISSSPETQRFADLALNSMTWQPSIDNDVLPRHPLKALEEGLCLDVPVLIGTNTDEGSMFVIGAGTYESATDKSVLQSASALGARDPARVVELATDAQDPHPGRTLTNLLNMWKFQLPMRIFLELRAKYSAPTYRYKFTWASPKFGGALGAHHMLELPFTFNTVTSAAGRATVAEEVPAALTDATHSAWISFIKELEPGWQPYYGETTTTGVFDETGLTIATDLDEDTFAAWNGLR